VIQIETAPGEDRERTQIGLGVYFGLLLLAGNLASPIGIPAIPVQFYLKDRLHLGADQVALFMAVAGLPLVVGFLFGFLRDRWRPFNLGDRGYILIAAPPLLLAYLWLGLRKPVFGPMLAGYLLAALFYRFVQTSMQSLTTVVGQRLLMTGRLSALWNLLWVLPQILSYLAGGWLIDRFDLRPIMLFCGGMAGLLFLAASWEPRHVTLAEASDPVANETGFAAIARLLRHRPIWPAALIWLMWNFSPGFQTPSLYYLTNSLHLSSTQYGIWKALFFVGLLPTIALYAPLCRRFSLNRLLWVGAITAIPQMTPLLFARTPASAMASAVLMGLLGGFPQAAYWDLVMRSCPEGLEGTAVMLADSGLYVAYIAGDLVGTQLYRHGGFLPNVIAMTVTYALILPVLLRLPRRVTAHTEDAPES
jgi:MFS family permease